MPRPTFGSLTRHLLDAGIAPRFAHRVRAELRDHYRDLEREALNSGKTPSAACTEAHRRLGSQRAIVTGFLERPELRSWIYRSQVLTVCLRTICYVYLLLLKAKRAPATAAAVRFGIATGAAGLVTAATLLTLDMSLRVAPAERPIVNGLTAATVTIGIPDGGSRQLEPAAEQTDVRDDIVRVVEDLNAPANGTRPDTPQLDHQVALSIDLPAIEFDPEPRVAARDFAIPDGDYLPIVKVSPIFPALAAERGIEGYVIVEYTVTATGTVRDLVVVESSSSLFEQSALEAAAKFRYKPRVVGGHSVAVPGVRTIIRFELDRSADGKAFRLWRVGHDTVTAAIQNSNRTPPNTADPLVLNPHASSYFSSRRFSTRPKISARPVSA